MIQPFKNFVSDTIDEESIQCVIFAKIIHEEGRLRNVYNTSIGDKDNDVKILNNFCFHFQCLFDIKTSAMIS